jgi:hypothetical protein
MIDSIVSVPPVSRHCFVCVFFVFFRFFSFFAAPVPIAIGPSNDSADMSGCNHGVLAAGVTIAACGKGISGLAETCAIHRKTEITQQM